MPRLSAAQLAQMRIIKVDNYADALDIYRPPTVASLKRGDQTLATSAAPCRRWPASKAPKILALIPEIAGARVDELIFFPDSLANVLARGGELRSASGQKLKIEGLGRWQTSVAVAASLITPS